MGKLADRAKEMFYEGYNCCQAVVGAFAEYFGFDSLTALRTVEGLGGGTGRLRLTCGAVSAIAVVAGMKMSHGLPADLKKRGEIYGLIQQMCNEFKQKNGSYVCAELLGSSLPKDNSPTPEARTPEYYKKRPCPEYVYDAALIIEKYLCN